ncbi:MAG: glycosyltransferase [bacterium]|nr:glycosyltransferase [bacterium]
MAMIWCISAPLFSHTDWGGFLKTAHELAQRGHAVTWVSQTGIADAVQKHGLPFAAIRETGWLWPPPPVPDIAAMKPQDAVMLRYRRALDTWLTTDLVADGVQALLDLAAARGKPDLILTDPFLTASALAAEALDVPLIVCGWPAQQDFEEGVLFPVQRALGSESQERMAALYRRFGLAGVNISQGATPAVLSPHLHISYFCNTWYQADLPSLLPQNRFVGGLPEPISDPLPAWLRAIPDDAPLGLVTLGTTFAGELGFFSWAAQAMARAGLIPVVAIGWHPYTADEKAALKAALPPSTRLLNWVSFAQLLPRTRLITHHGGMGTTHWAVRYGVPQIIVPHAADQRGQARRAAQAKVGLNLTAHDVKQGALFTGVRAIASDERVQHMARSLAAEMSALGGVSTAADAVEAVLNAARPA